MSEETMVQVLGGNVRPIMERMMDECQLSGMAVDRCTDRTVEVRSEAQACRVIPYAGFALVTHRQDLFVSLPAADSLGDLSDPRPKTTRRHCGES